MKASTLITSWLLLLPFMLAGQPYQTIYPEREAFFQDHYGRIEAIGIDSMQTGPFTILYPFRVNQVKNWDCNSPFLASWIGPKVVIAENGINYFFNLNNDTIVIDTKASLHTEWNAYYMADSLLIKATVLEHDLELFLGITDSVKTIGFQAFDKNMQPVNMPLNTMRTKISKNHGWVKTLNLSLFPNYPETWSNGSLREYLLVGLSDPKIGVQNLTWFDVYDFAIGDEIHILTKSGLWEGWIDGYFKTTETRSIYKYIDRIDYTDSIQYTYTLEQNVILDWLDSLTYSFDTLSETIQPFQDFDMMPSQPVIYNYKNNSSQISYHYFIMQHGEFTSKTQGNFWFEPYTENCWYTMHYDGATYAHNYIKGLGGPYSPYWAMFGHSYGKELVYYQKDDLNWGTPLKISNSVKQVVTPILVSVFPVPVSDRFTVRLGNGANGNDYTFEMYDISARLVNRANLTNGDNIIQVNNIKPGIYLYTIRNSDAIIKMDKMVVR